MATIGAVAQAFKQAESSWQEEVVKELSSHSADIADYVREQLYSGLGGDEPITPSYLDDPYFATQAEAEKYRDWKLKITPPVASPRLGLPARDPNTPNLFINGYYHSHIEVSQIAGGLHIGSDGDSLAEDITSEYGDKFLYRLGERAKFLVKYDYILPTLERIFGKFTN